MIRIALTGNAAAGKSTVARLLEAWGVPLIDADRIVHQLQAPGTPLLARIAQRFGPEILMPGGELNRSRLRSLILKDPQARSDLEALVHPAVEQRRGVLEEQARRQGARLVVHDIPLLFEALDPAAFDAVILVDAPEPTRLARLRERGLSDAEARDLMAAQLPATVKRSWKGGPGHRPVFLIENDGNEAVLEERARRVWGEVTATLPPS